MRLKKRICTSGQKVADAVLADLYLPEYEKMKLVKKMAYAPRYENWEKLGILPGGAKSEVCHGVVKCSTNLNSDPVDMLKDCLKLGISTGIYGLTLTNLLNDIVLGEPKLRLAPVGLRVIDPDYINIMITGHQHSMFTYLQERLTDADITEKAKQAEQKGLSLSDVLVSDKISSFEARIMKMCLTDMPEITTRAKRFSPQAQSMQ